MVFFSSSHTEYHNELFPRNAVHLAQRIEALKTGKYHPQERALFYEWLRDTHGYATSLRAKHQLGVYAFELYREPYLLHLKDIFQQIKGHPYSDPITGD